MSRLRIVALLAALFMVLPLAPVSEAPAQDRRPDRPEVGLGHDGPERALRAGRGALRRYARDTWRSFEAMTDGRLLPEDNLCRVDEPSRAWDASGYTSPTNIGAYLWSVLVAEELRLIHPAEADRRLAETVEAVAALETAQGGQFYNWYDPTTGAVLETWPGTDDPIRPFLSSVDNGWLAAALMIVAEARPELAPTAHTVLDAMDFGLYYDPEVGLLRGGWWADTDEPTAHFYDLLNTETRIGSYVGITKGDVPPEHYYHLSRTLPPEFDWQQQIPEGEWHTYLGVDVFQGHYTIGDLRVVPSWGGSMFEALMPALIVPEAAWAPDSWAVNHPLYVEGQIRHGAVDNPDGFWGFSPASVPEGGYREYGAPELGSNPDGYHSDNVVTPHAVFLALEFAPAEVLANLRALSRSFDVYGRFGFLDSVDVGSGVVSDCVLALDQGMIMAAIGNAVGDGLLHDHFADAAGEVLRPVIAPERFTAGRG